jgi:hypothetical protein
MGLGVVHRITIVADRETVKCQLTELCADDWLPSGIVPVQKDNFSIYV